MCGNCDIQSAPGHTVTDQALVYARAHQAEIIRHVEDAVRQMKPGFMDVTHTIENGVYTRTGRVKAGELIIGAKHRSKNVFHLAKGKVIVWDNLNGLRLLVAPHSEISFPGIQRIGLVVEDIEGSNIFETDKTTVEEVESEMLYPLIVPENVGEKVLALIGKHSLLK